jgi:hypothetical protein
MNMKVPKVSFAVLAALFVFLTCDVAVLSQAQAPAPEEIVKKMAERYATLSSYQDTGVVETVTDGPLSRRGTDIGFKTHFTRPKKLRFEWLDYGSPLSVERNAIWSDGTKIARFYSWEPDHVESKDDISLAVAGATGISRGSAHTVPELLIADIGGFSLKELTKLTLKKQEMFEGENCYVIEGYHPSGEAWQMWIGTKDFLLRKLRMKIGSAKDEFEEEIHREIKVDDKIAEETYQLKTANGRIVNLITKEKEADLQRLLTFITPRDRINHELNTIVTLLKAGWPQVPDKTWREVFTEVRLDADLLLQMFVSIYDWHYTADEIKQLVAIYETPLGQKISRNTDLIQSEAVGRTETIATELLKLIQEKLKAKGYKSAA